MSFHLLAPSKEQHTGDVIAELIEGGEVGEKGERVCVHGACAEHGALRLEWLLGYFISAQAVILLKCVYSCQTCVLTCMKRRYQCYDLVVNP